MILYRYIRVHDVLKHLYTQIQGQREFIKNPREDLNADLKPPNCLGVFFFFWKIFVIFFEQISFPIKCASYKKVFGRSFRYLSALEVK